MGLNIKAQLPDTYLPIKVRYLELLNKASRTTSGNLNEVIGGQNFTITDNTGETGLLKELQKSLYPYNVEASDYNSIINTITDNLSALSLLKDSTDILTPNATVNVNAIMLPISLRNKKRYSFKANATSTGLVIINGLPFKKSDGTQIGANGVKINKVYDFYYDSDASCVFILAKAEGNAVEQDVLAGKTFSTDNFTDIVGTIPNKIGSATAYTVSTVDQAVAKGYTDGAMNSVKIKGEPNLLPIYVMAGKAIGDIVGTSPTGKAGIQEYTVVGTYAFTVPIGVVRLFAMMIAGGGGGGGTEGGYYGAGGGSGGFGITPIEVVAGQVITIVVGAGGALGTPYIKYPNGDWTSAGNGMKGGSTSVGAFSVTGGEGGGASNIELSCTIGLGGVGLGYGNNGNKGDWSKTSGSWSTTYGVWNGNGGIGNMGYGSGGRGSSSAGDGGKVVILW